MYGLFVSLLLGLAIVTITRLPFKNALPQGYVFLTPFIDDFWP